MHASLKRLLQRTTRRFGYEVVRFERVLAGHLTVLISQLSITSVLDVGAHHGEFALMLRDAGFDGRIVSLEPVAEAYRVAERAASSDPNWTVHQLALGRTNGNASINVARSTDFSSFLSLTPYGAELERNAEPVRQERVRVARLDDVADDLLGRKRGNLFVKCDTQGWDLEVLRGADKTLRDVALVQVEMAVKPIYADAPPLTDMFEFLSDRGFEMTGAFPVVVDPDRRLVEFDCVMARVGARGLPAQPAGPASYAEQIAASAPSSRAANRL